MRMIHLFNYRPFHKDPAFRLFLAMMLAAFLLFFFGCAEREPLPTLDDRLHGAWERNWHGFEQTWFFDDGLCTAHSIIPAQPVQAYFWYYTCEGDTITFSNLAASGLFRDEIKAVVEFPTDSTAVFSWIGGISYFLKRI